jgi:hypothetical protein
MYIYDMLDGAMDHIADFSVTTRRGIWQIVGSLLSVAS